MTLPSSGTLTLNEIKTEFGGPNDLKAYYRGGTYVPNSSGNAGIPTSGTINIRSFLGASAFNGAIHTYTTSGTETVPAGAKTVVIEAWGAGGGGNFLSNGGGAYTKSSYSCSGGQTLVYTFGASATTVTSGTLAITAMSAGDGGVSTTWVGGTASGGNVENLAGGNTSNGTSVGGNGGAGANGGAGGVAPSGNGTFPGGGGAGTGTAGGNGAGGQVRFTYT